MSDAEPDEGVEEQERKQTKEEPAAGTAADRRKGSLSKREKRLARQRGKRRILIRDKKHADDSREKRLKKARSIHALTKKQQFKDIKSSIEEIRREKRSKKESEDADAVKLLREELKTLKKFKAISERIWRTHKEKHGEAGKHARKMEKIVSQFRGRLLPDRSRRASAFQNLQMRAERKRFMKAKKESVSKKVKK